MTEKKVVGVLMDRVKSHVVAAALKRHGIDKPKSIEDGVRKLAAYYREETPGNRLADCSVCGGISDVNEPVCPYCGEGDESPATALATAPVAPSAVGQLLTISDLDAAVQRVQALKVESAGALWDLGTEVRRIHSLGLWKLRADEKGAPQHKAWSSFVENELGISTTYAYKLIDVAEVYSREQVRTIGVAKLHVTLQVPKEHRDKLLAQAEGGASVRELSQKAKQIGKKPKESRTPGVGGARGGGRKAEKVTVAALIGRVEIPLLKGMSEKPARAMTDTPRGTERLMNGVTQVFVVAKNEQGEWILIVERVRE